MNNENLDTKPLILIIDDEPDILELLTITLDRIGLASETAASVKEAIVKLKSKRYNLCLSDLRLPDGSGMEIVNYIQKSIPELPIAVISAHGNMQAAISAMKAGAFDFISKPIDLKKLRILIESALAIDTPLDKQTDVEQRVPNLLGESSAIQQLRSQISKLSRSMAPVHISGESGTGKELVARLIHHNSPRKNKPFIAVNSSAIPAELMESEFFGFLKGSFTGAVADKAGLFQAADGGTLFLDEVADLPLPMQAKLLRAIQERCVRPIGAQEEVDVDVRILSATHQSLRELVAQKKFREDLFYRINVIEIPIPPLRERRDDIPLILAHKLKNLSSSTRHCSLEIDNVAMQSLLNYQFPGNIRELENILERAAALSDSNILTVNDLNLERNQNKHTDIFVNTSNCLNNESLDDYLYRKEREIILHALDAHSYHITQTAESLGLSFRALRYKIKKLDLSKEIKFKS